MRPIAWSRMPQPLPSPGGGAGCDHTARLTTASNVTNMPTSTAWTRRVVEVAVTALFIDRSFNVRSSRCNDGGEPP
jgi:hypothetical protein